MVMLAHWSRLWTAGRAIKGKRSQVQLCTKFAIKFTKEGGMSVDGSRKYVRHVMLSNALKCYLLSTQAVFGIVP